MVEQRTENPCVPGSIPGGTTKVDKNNLSTFVFLLYIPQVIKILMSIALLF